MAKFRCLKSTLCLGIMCIRMYLLELKGEDVRGRYVYYLLRYLTNIVVLIGNTLVLHIFLWYLFHLDCFLVFQNKNLFQNAFFKSFLT